MKMTDYTILILLLSVWGAKYSTALALNCPLQICVRGVWDPTLCQCVEGCNLTPWSCPSPHTYFDEIACKCQCPPTPCPSNQELNKLTCRCKCPNSCPSPKEPDPQTCACRCPEGTNTNCVAPKEFNWNTCTCECPNSCPPPKIQDHSTCQCSCGISVCPSGTQLNQDLCQCLTHCPLLCPGIVNPFTCECVN